MAKIFKWLGGGLGWAAGGPIGALLGFALGSVIDGIQKGSYEYQTHRRPDFSTPQTTPNDFVISLLVLTAAVMKSDQKVLRSELEYVKKFLLLQFGEREAERQLLMLRELLKQDYNLQQVCSQIKTHMEYPSKLQLMHFLFGLAVSDSEIKKMELDMITSISNYLGIRSKDFESIKAMFVKDSSSAYKILEITPEATDDEIKKAYKKMAVKHHPDKVAHLGDEIQKAANAKFQEVNSAWDTIKKERGIM